MSQGIHTFMKTRCREAWAIELTSIEAIEVIDWPFWAGSSICQRSFCACQLDIASQQDKQSGFTNNAEHDGSERSFKRWCYDSRSLVLCMWGSVRFFEEHCEILVASRWQTSELLYRHTFVIATIVGSNWYLIYIVYYVSNASWLNGKNILENIDH